MVETHVDKRGHESGEGDEVDEDVDDGQVHLPIRLVREVIELPIRQDLSDVVQSAVLEVELLGEEREVPGLVRVEVVDSGDEPPDVESEAAEDVEDGEEGSGEGGAVETRNGGPVKGEGSQTQSTVTRPKLRQKGEGEGKILDVKFRMARGHYVIMEHSDAKTKTISDNGNQIKSGSNPPDTYLPQVYLFLYFPARVLRQFLCCQENRVLNVHTCYSCNECGCCNEPGARRRSWATPSTPS